MTAEILDELARVIAEKSDAGEGSSYTAALLAKGLPHVTRKLGEEAVELVVASLSGSRGEVVSESADLLYHWLVLLASKGVAVEEVWQELARRQGVSGLDEKASRKL